MDTGSGSHESYEALLSALPRMNGPLARETLLLSCEEVQKRYLSSERSSERKHLEKLFRKRILPYCAAMQQRLGEDSALTDAQEEVLVLMGDGDIVKQSLEQILSGEMTDTLSARSTFPAIKSLLATRSEWDRRLVEARLLLWNREYGPAMSAFALLRNEQKEAFFSLSPQVLADYGRAVQYGGDAEQGAADFLALDTAFARDELFVPEMTQKDRDARRFVLLFFAGRMLRQKGKSDEARKSFSQSLVFAPDAVQRDAVLWYLLDNSIKGESDGLLSSFEEYLPLVSDRNSVSSFLDRMQGRLLAERRYAEVIRSHLLIDEWGDPASAIRSSWIVARLVDLAYLPPEELRALLGIAESVSLRNWTDIQYHRIFDSDTASFYYRSLAAIVLGKEVDPLPDSFSGKGEETAQSNADTMAGTTGTGEVGADWEKEDWMLWLEAAKKWGQMDVLPGIASSYKAIIPADILGAIARMQSLRGEYYQSIVTIGVLLGRAGYQLSRDELMYLYPRAWQQELDTAAMVWGVPPEIMAGLARSESAFRADVTSHAGAVGLVQIMPATGRDIAKRIAKRVPLAMDGDNPILTDAFTNAQLGAWYLADWTKRLSSPLLALFAYNAGPGRVRQWRAERPDLPEDLFLETVPFDETRNYGRRVLAAAAVYGYLYYGYDMSLVAKDLFGSTTDFSVRSAY